MFDMPEIGDLEERFSCEIPDLSEQWIIGLIVGPSGSGKTTIAKRAFGELCGRAEWDDRPVIDNFPSEISVKDIVGTLTSVGLSSPPAWLKPYGVLSNGEQFRCDLARALLSGRQCVVFDEFTSVVDRTVGKIASAAVSKHLRRAGSPRFVAVTCHYDVLEWLQPDWVLDMATRRLSRRSLCRRPEIRVDLHEADSSCWPIFAKHHYLNTRSESLVGCRCVVGCIDGAPAVFVAVRQAAGHHGIKRISRVVVLPDFQGIGIGGAVTTDVARSVVANGHRCTLTTSHPAMVRCLMRSPEWRLIQRLAVGSRQVNNREMSRWLKYASLRPLMDSGGGSVGRPVCRFEFVGQA